MKKKVNKIPSFSRPSSATIPVGNILRTITPRWLMAVSLPPTMVNPSPFPSCPLFTHIVKGPDWLGELGPCGEGLRVCRLRYLWLNDDDKPVGGLSSTNDFLSSQVPSLNL